MLCLYSQRVNMVCLSFAGSSQNRKIVNFSGARLPLDLLVAAPKDEQVSKGFIVSKKEQEKKQRNFDWAQSRDQLVAAAAAGIHIAMFAYNLAFWGTEGMPQDRYWPAEPRCVPFYRTTVCFIACVWRVRGGRVHEAASVGFLFFALHTLSCVCMSCPVPRPPICSPLDFFITTYHMLQGAVAAQAWTLWKCGGHQAGKPRPGHKSAGNEATAAESSSLPDSSWH